MGNGKWEKRLLFQLWPWANMKMDLGKDDDLGIPGPDNGDKERIFGAGDGPGTHVLGKSGINIHLAIIKARPHTKYSNEQHFYLNRGGVRGARGARGSALRSGASWKFVRSLVE